MLKGKNLLIVLGVGAVAYYLYMQNKKKKAAKSALATTPGSASNFTGDLEVINYENAAGKGVPRFGTTVPTPSGLGRLGERLTFR